jgi:hypothetical protein
VLHLISDDGLPHAPTSECGCGPQLVLHEGRYALAHRTPDIEPTGPSWAAGAVPDMGDHVEGPAHSPDAAPAHQRPGLPDRVP